MKGQNSSKMTTREKFQIHLVKRRKCQLTINFFIFPHFLYPSKQKFQFQSSQNFLLGEALTTLLPNLNADNYLDFNRLMGKNGVLLMGMNDRGAQQAG